MSRRKLTDKQAAEIRASSASRKKLADDYGVSEAAIRQIKQFKTYANVSPFAAEKTLRRDWLFLSKAGAGTPKLSTILRVVSEDFGVSPCDIKGPRRHSSVALPRQVSCWLAYKSSNLSTTAIGRHLNRDHTTVIHSYQTIDRRITKDPKLFERVKRLEAMARVAA